MHQPTKILTSSLFLAVFGFATFTCAAELNSTQSEPESKIQFVREIEGIREFKLANGLQLLLIADDSRANMTVNMVYKVGARHEAYGKKGDGVYARTSELSARQFPSSIP